MDRKIESTIIWLFELLALGRSLGPDQEDALARYGDMYYSSCEDHDEPCSMSVRVRSNVTQGSISVCPESLITRRIFVWLPARSITHRRPSLHIMFA